MLFLNMSSLNATLHVPGVDYSKELFRVLKIDSRMFNFHVIDHLRQ